MSAPSPSRFIVVLFAKSALPPASLARMRAQMAAYLAERGQTLVDVIVECGPIKRDPSEHISLVRVARGEADGVCLFAFPARMSHQSSDVLGQYLTGPAAAFTAAQLAERGLLPGQALRGAEEASAG